MNGHKTVRLADSEIELRVDASLLPSVLRAFAGTTVRDAEVDALQIPRSPRWLNVCIRALRWYRTKRSKAIERRCVFDPSCSRYAELAFRRLGLVDGAIATLRRLNRCRPGSGGIDVP
jgi:putative component of membrane protein insertase Oxa1/YidC/SpoIIIJ protein YidD